MNIRILLLLLALVCASAAPSRGAEPATYRFANDRIQVVVTIEGERIVRERVELVGAPAVAAFETDGDFRIELIWNDWQAPGKANNGDVQVAFTAKDFRLVQRSVRRAGGVDEMALLFDGPEYLGVEIVYRLGGKDVPFARRRLRVFEKPHRQYARKDEGPTGHLLHALATYDAVVFGPVTPVKEGGFGQPVAVLTSAGGGAFAGLEWPSADNAIVREGAGQGERMRLRCAQEMGERVTFEGVWGETAVVAPTPDTRVKDAFGRYLDDVRVAPLRPYTLYNSWYDLRSAEYPKVQPAQVMNEANVLRIARALREKMVAKHGIALDAFVLDDGWDVYRSAWELRREQFPRGLAPIADELVKSNTRLGVWFGPTGGYSFHGVRTDWFREHGYEVTDNNMLSVIGPKYAALFRERTTEFARAGVGYFKWDGLQFVDGNPANGGPLGIYGRRVGIRNVFGFAESVRRVDPDVFLNITSGTWLSPWWLRAANTIWMDGGDYGDADVPSFTKRDSAITYRDMVLYDDFRTKGLWFPIANLMTHGIIKGTLDVDEIGRGEPLSKFADETVFYLARGVTMYELYVAPDILGEGEWGVLADGLRWARANFDVLKRGELVGGSPLRSEPYGYVHFAGERGIVAVRNPGVNAASIAVVLDPAAGLGAGARELLLERVYPTRWIAPRLYKAGDVLTLPLAGYEAAVYELRPMRGVTEPLFADVVFEEAQGARGTLRVTAVGPEARLLNRTSVTAVRADGKPIDVGRFAELRVIAAPFVAKPVVGAEGANVTSTFTLDRGARDARLGVLLRPSAGTARGPLPAVRVVVDGRAETADVVDQDGVWAWHTVRIGPGAHRVEWQLARTAPAGAELSRPAWNGHAEVWIVGAQAVPAITLTVEGAAPREQRPLPPTGRGPGEVPRVERVGAASVTVR